MISLIWVTSPIVMSLLVMLIRRPVAPEMEMLSSSGLEMACCAASRARFSPWPTPVPMSAEPPFCITVRTSAKSTLMRPVRVMRSAMPWVALSSTSSAFISASSNLKPLPTTAMSRSLGTTIIVSTPWRISMMPVSACFIRFWPSKRKGLVTMPTVRAPMSRAIWAMIGAAPVPVPPPMPQVTKTRSAPCMAATTSSRFSSIAWRPISGRAPAPSPRGSFFPICTFRSDFDFVSACASVLTEMNSTPTSRASIMRLTALPPPPPTPITFIRACCAPCSSISKIMKRALAFSEEVLEPSLDWTEHLLDGRRSPSRGESPAGHHFLRAVEQQPHGHRHARRLDAVYQPGQPLTGSADPHGEGEHLAGQLHQAGGLGDSAGQNDSRRKALAIPRPGDLVEHELEDFLEPHVHDVRQHAAVRIAGSLAGGTRQLKHVGLGHQRLICSAEALFHPLCILLRDLETVHDIVRHMTACKHPARGVTDLATVKNRDVGRTATQLDNCTTQLPLVRGEDREGGGHRLQHELPDVVPPLFAPLPEVLDRAREHGEEGALRFGAGAGHPDRVGDPLLLVHQVVLGDGVEQLVVPAEADVARHVVDPGHVRGADLDPGDRDHAVGAPGRDVLAGDTAVHRANLHAGHELGLPHGLVDGAGGLLDVPHDAPADPAGPLHRDAEDAHARGPDVAAPLTDQGHDLARAEVERGHQMLGLAAHAVAPRRITCGRNRPSSSRHRRPCLARRSATRDTSRMSSPDAPARKRILPASTSTATSGRIRTARWIRW